MFILPNHVQQGIEANEAREQRLVQDQSSWYRQRVPLWVLGRPPLHLACSFRVLHYLERVLPDKYNRIAGKLNFTSQFISHGELIGAPCSDLDGNSLGFQSNV